ncbi:hypothetical protein OPQ81_010655 [Rhizoctonia solani]|nr:hypothetical protein OPQ81_010655 [Rhizoctonia solani]
MGKPSSSQPRHFATSIEPYARPHTRRRARSKASARQRDLALFPTKDVANTNVPSQIPSPSPFPSPLINSLSEKFYDAQEDFLSHASIATEDEDEEMFYDAHEGPSEQHNPVFADVHQIIPEPEHDGAAKGNIARGRNTRTTTLFAAPPATTPAPAVSAFSFSFPSSSRGSAKPTVTPTAGPTVATPAAEEALRAALVVGINYATTLEKDRRLYYAVRDARLWQETFRKKGVSSDNIKIITDAATDGNSEAPTCTVLLKYIRWLVQDARDGDSLFFVYSGHSILTNDGPSIVASDKAIFSRRTLEQELVMQVPKGVDLQVIFDCCHSAGMISLQYCVGRMAKPTPPSSRLAEKLSACSVGSEISESLETDMASPRPSPYPHAPQHASLYGIPAAADATLEQPPVTPGPPPVTPAMVGQESFGGPPQRHTRGGGVVAAAPLAAAPATAAGNCLGPAAGVVSYVRSLVGIGSTSALAPTPVPAPAPAPASVQTPAPAPSETAAARTPTAPGPRRARQGVVEGDRMPDYFEERKNGFLRPAGKVMVWAGTGENQQAFEAYGGAKQGVVTKAMCAALAACADRVGTRRELWSYLVQEIESENNHRKERDANKSGRVPFMPRVQHAELWVSQGDPFVPLSSAAPVLDQPML